MTSLAKNDIIVNNMMNEMYRIKKNQLKNFKNLNESKSQNKLLKDVVEDYKSYYDIIKQEKQQQYDTLVKISEYINSVSRDLTKTDNILLHQSIKCTTVTSRPAHFSFKSYF